MSVVDAFERLSYGPAPESSGPAMDWLGSHAHRFDLFINNQWVEPATGNYFEVANPATTAPLCRVAEAGMVDVDRAVAAADAAFSSWSALPDHARARYLYALARAIQRDSRLFAVVESLDNGKPIRESRDLDVPLAARHFYYHAGWAQLRSSEFPGFRPIGVIGQIIPWNFPLLMLAWKIAPALAAGNTVVLKPAEYTPLTALLFAETVERAGLPPGVVNIVTGAGETGAALVRHEGVRKIAFTGSTEVGREIRRATAGSGKHLSLELGGKSPFVVLDDADLDGAVEGAVDAIWFNQGEVCCAGSRLLVQESIEDRVLRKVRERMETLRSGDPLDKAIDIGAIVAPVQLQRIERLVRQGIDEGASLWQPSWSCPADGYFYPPTLLTGVTPAATVAQVEIFGPVLVAMSFRTPSEAVHLANNTPYGLAASIWSENINVALDMARQIRAGTVWINSTNLFDAAAGFGGYRESGYGREGGREGMFEYLEPPAGPPPPSRQAAVPPALDRVQAEPAFPPIDRTAKQFIGGKQMRADSGYSRPVYDSQGRAISEVGEGNRKDIRNAVEAARASRWADMSGHARAQVLYFLAENLDARASEFSRRLQTFGSSLEEARGEVERSLEALFTFAAWADKFDGLVHQTPFRNVTLAMREPMSIVGIVCPDDLPLLAFVSACAAALCTGCSVVAVPSEIRPLLATDFYQVLETSDVPSGTLNIVTGPARDLARVLADHDAVESVWYFGGVDGARDVELASAGNMKRTWVHDRSREDLFCGLPETAEQFLREATHVKNIWVPYGA